jgi:hypothetical protein
MDANITGLRQQFHTREGFDLRQAEAIAALQVEVERIKTRLELSDAP